MRICGVLDFGKNLLPLRGKLMCAAGVPGVEHTRSVAKIPIYQRNMIALKPGETLQHGIYRIEKVLGQGGFGITYLAADLNLQRKVAIKEFFPKDYCDRSADTSNVTLGTQSTAEFVQRLKMKFLKEARNIAKFNHPGIIKIYSAFEENNTAYYVMEYIEGEALSTLVERDGPLDARRALNYIRSVGNALAYVHDRKINHLDVKPANIMLRRSDDTPILIDFGLSKQYDAEGKQTSTTPTGLSYGYAPLEQYNRGGVKEFSPQTDLYSLAATLYFILSGIVPPQALDLVECELTFPELVPTPLISPIGKAMSSSRFDRHNSIGAFLSELKNEPVSYDTVPMPDTPVGRPAPRSGVRPGAQPAPQPVPQPTPQPAPHPALHPTPHPAPPKPRTNLSTLWYIIGAAVCVAAFVVIFIFVNRRGSDGSEIPTPQPSPENTVQTVKTVKDMYYESSLGPCSYTGEVDTDGKPDGRGRAEWKSGIGKSYDGQWKHGEMDGDCTYLNRDGYKFEGKFKDGHYSEGKLIAPDKSYYIGTFDKNGELWTGTDYDAKGNKTDTWKNGK